jgi:membrane protein DedA with SNARE-associated domain
MRRVAVGALAAPAVFFALTALGAVVATAGTGTLSGRATAWVLVCLVAAVLAGFVGCRVAVASPRPWRLLAAVAGPAALSLVYTVTTHARGSGLWIAFFATVIGAVCGAGLRDGVGRVQRRRLKRGPAGAGIETAERQLRR